jgi:hypothetical protein
MQGSLCVLTRGLVLFRTFAQEVQGEARPPHPSWADRGLDSRFPALSGARALSAEPSSLVLSHGHSQRPGGRALCPFPCSELGCCWLLPPHWPLPLSEPLGCPPAAVGGCGLCSPEPGGPERPGIPLISVAPPGPHPAWPQQAAMTGRASSPRRRAPYSVDTWEARSEQLLALSLGFMAGGIDNPVFSPQCYVRTGTPHDTTESQVPGALAPTARPVPTSQTGVSEVADV